MGLYFRFIIYSIIYGSTKSAYKKASFLKRSNLFKSFGERCYWHPMTIPSFPNCISIGDNVTVCADVKFFEHDIVHRMWNDDPDYSGPNIAFYKKDISVGNNVVLGGNSIILYGVAIGNNALVAAGSVVTHSVNDFEIVAGNPAVVIGNTRDLYNKRLSYTLQKSKDAAD